MTEIEALRHDIERHQTNLAQAERVIDRMQAALEDIRENAATRNNGGAWAAGVAVLCLASSDKGD